MPAAVAIPAVLGAVGVGGSIFSGISGASAAKSAAKTQADAAKAAGDQAIASANQYNPQITSAAQAAGQSVTQAAGAAGQQAIDAAKTAGAGVNDAAAQANALLNPYAVTGEAADSNIRAGLAPGGAFSKTPTAADIQLDPGFANRLKYGLQSVERSAAARGIGNSGTALMNVNDYAQTQASSEFDKAYNRFLQTRQQNFDFANTAAGRGASVAGTEGQNLIGAGKYSGDTGINTAQFAGGLNTGASEYAGDKTYGAASQTAANSINAAGKAGEYLAQGANAQAAGKVGAANAVSNAVGQGIGAISSAGNLYNNLKNPIKYQIGGKP